MYSPIVIDSEVLGRENGVDLMKWADGKREGEREGAVTERVALKGRLFIRWLACLLVQCYVVQYSLEGVRLAGEIEIESGGKQMG